ncbi:MAG: glycosyl transferase [Mediterranea massiliensis]|nr:glycosyl transferase [Mediterranea massiliensis]
MNDKIDFVIIWVDNNDPLWQQEYNKYANKSASTDDKSTARYRDWDNLRYWFRGVEKFAPWVNKIHFVTCGHYPKWLNLKAPKLNFVKHEDYIPHEYLPVFSANPIEIHLHRIPELAEKFVFFNDDLFLINNVSPERFFKNGLPCDMAACTVAGTLDFTMSHIATNNMYCIESTFDKKKVILKHWNKWFHWKYDMGRLLKTFCLLPFSHFATIFDPHLSNAFLKETFYSVWSQYEESLVRTSQSRFRSIADNNQYLFRYWQLLTGNFEPTNVTKDGKYYSISEESIEEIERVITSQNCNLLVLNDSNEIKSFETIKNRINNAFETILPNKSDFELF